MRLTFPPHRSETQCPQVVRARDTTPCCHPSPSASTETASVAPVGVHRDHLVHVLLVLPPRRPAADHPAAAHFVPASCETSAPPRPQEQRRSALRAKPMPVFPKFVCESSNPLKNCEFSVRPRRLEGPEQANGYWAVAAYQTSDVQTRTRLAPKTNHLCLFIAGHRFAVLRLAAYGVGCVDSVPCCESSGADGTAGCFDA